MHTHPPKAVFFGEVLMRLQARHFERFLQARSFSAGYTGAEANAAVSLENWGVDTYLVSAVPPNDIGDACINTFRSFGIDTKHVIRQGDRLGTYYLESGVDQRPSKVIYDRAHSAFSELRPGQIPWDEILRDKEWLHVSGTCLALTANTTEATLEACERAQANNVKVSFDPNFRSTLWRWDLNLSPHELATRSIRQILPHVNVLLANWGQAADVFGIRVDQPSGPGGTPGLEQHALIARRIAAESKSIDAVALTLRESLSAHHNRFSAMVYDVGSDRVVQAPQASDNAGQPAYTLSSIVDRVGSGDTFAAGLIRGMLLKLDLQETLDFATAAGCLKHTIPGDFGLVSIEEVEALMKGDGAGRIKR